MEELIVKENNQKRLDSYVTDKLSKVSRTTAQRLIEEEKIPEVTPDNHSEKQKPDTPTSTEKPFGFELID